MRNEELFNNMVRAIELANEAQLVATIARREANELIKAYREAESQIEEENNYDGKSVLG